MDRELPCMTAYSWSLFCGYVPKGTALRQQGCSTPIVTQVPKPVKIGDQVEASRKDN